MAKRTDVHRPSAINPEDYEFVALEYQKIAGLEDVGAVLCERAIIEAHMKRTGGTYSGHDHAGNCHVCGAHCIYTALFYHEATNSYIRTGMDCAEKMWACDANRFRVFREAIAAAREAKAGKAKAQGILAENNLTRCWEVYANNDNEQLVKDGWKVARTIQDGHYTCDCVAEHGWNGARQAGLVYNQRAGLDHSLICPKCKGYGTYEGELRDVVVYDDTKEYHTITDIVGKLVKYGSISPNQLRYLGKLLSDHDNKAVREAKYAAEKAIAKDCPEGRVTVTGQVIKTECRATDFGDSLKMLFKADEGFMLWGTVPSSLHWVDATGGGQRPLQRGDKVQLTATVTRSDKDSKFGFFKRPTGKFLG